MSASVRRNQKQLHGTDILVPTSIFRSRDLSFSESLVDYLWTQHRLPPSQIGALLSMDRRNVYTLMTRLSSKRQSIESHSSDDQVFLPIEVLASREAPVLESVVAYLRTRTRLTNKEIARLLNRSEKTVSTAYCREKARGGIR